MEKLSGIIRWAQCNDKRVYKREAGESESEKKDGKTPSCWP